MKVHRRIQHLHPAVIGAMTRVSAMAVIHAIAVIHVIVAMVAINLGNLIGYMK